MATAKITPQEQTIYPCPPKAKVLICIDGSRESENAFKFYMNVLHHEDYFVALLHVSECVNVHTGFTIADDGSLDEHKITEKMLAIRKDNRDLDSKFRKIAQENNLNFELYTVSGEAGVERSVIKAMKEHQVSFVVMGSRGLGKIRRTVLGSVSHYVLHHSDIPVFICPPKIPPSYYDMPAKIQ